MTLRTRFALTIAGLVAVAVAAASTFAWLSTRSELRDEMDATLLARVETVRRVAVRPPTGNRPVIDLGRRGVVATSEDAIVVVDERGDVIAFVEGDPSLPIDDEARRVAAAGRPAAPVLQDVEVDGAAWRLVVAPLPSGGAVVVGRSLAEVEQVLAGLRSRLALVGLLATAVGAAAGWLLARRETEPLERLTHAAEHVAATRDLTTSIDVRGQDEVGRLAASFDTMLEALATSLDQQNRLIQDAGHELRTPLTSLRTNIDVLGQLDRLDADDRERLLADLRAELHELTVLVDELVRLAADPEAGRADPQPVRLDDVVRRAVANLERRTGRRVEVAAAPTTVLGDDGQLERAVANLLGNADKFSPADQPIHVEVGAGRVEVRDHGPGIEPQDRDRVFDRFYRSAGARSAPGSGLGLAIVRKLVEAHGGEVHVTDAPGGGAAVGFTVPEHR